MEMDLEQIQQEYERLRKEYEEVSRLKAEYEEAIKKAYADPELREPLKTIMKKVANIELEDPPHEKFVKSEVESLRKELEELKSEKEKAAQAQYATSLKEVLDRYGITGDEVIKFKEFVSRTGLVPTSIAGWETAAQNYRRSLVAEPILGRPRKFKEVVTSEDFLKDPSGALDKVFMQALMGGKK